MVPEYLARRFSIASCADSVPLIRKYARNATRCSKSTRCPLLLVTFDVSDAITPAAWSPGCALCGTTIASGTTMVCRAATVIILLVRDAPTVNQEPASTCLACRAL